jgi:hypothetical protein
VAAQQRAAWVPVVLLVHGLNLMVAQAQRQGALMDAQCHLPPALIKASMKRDVRISRAFQMISD